MIILNEENGEVYDINSEDGLNIVWGIGDGAYNLHDTKNNSDQDYEGNFYDPTEKYKRNEDISNLTWDVNIATIDEPIGLKDDNQIHNVCMQNTINKQSTIPEKHYNFIKENFDFLEETGEVLEKDRVKVVNNTEDEMEELLYIM